MSDWQSCLATVSVPPERGRELSAVSTEQRRQLLIFYLSVIFVFNREKASERGKCVCVCLCVYVGERLLIFGAHVFICRSAVCTLPISLWRGQCEHTQRVYTVASALLPFKVDSWPTNTTIYPLLTLLTNWIKTGRWKETCRCVSVCCVYCCVYCCESVFFFFFFRVKSNLSRHFQQGSEIMKRRSWFNFVLFAPKECKNVFQLLWIGWESIKMEEQRVTLRLFLTSP